ncbi:M20/M25/M40 family metallo-hydrolase [Polymorphobacter multimanifer]|uniref:Acetylornithine deacetylase/succinyl-diaminopimelate desuccinylase-like protein n=1 Tax=Polymorphobacter multimanifer TaxID=1070431 RepID=A0A841L7U4_9SPHN|nr:M20/M25/M40 family metallo-hydrolase [Polymorphobacter multimanifer]MBB6228276.1 acetylornithine deacetylase/succinyl-diaminopimelate desuccinylase-like protein [Polymorphobacter multimanifer]
MIGFARLAAIAASGALAGAIALPAHAAPVTDADRAMAREIVSELVAIPTVKGAGHVPALIATVTRRLKAAGFTDADIITVPVTVDTEPTAGLIVRLAGRGKAKPVALLGHMDVVGAVPGSWDTDPFKPVEKDGYLYARGASDNKAGVSALLATFIRLKRENWVPSRDFLLVFSGDEETGMQTTKALVKHPLVASAEFALNSDAGGAEMEADGSNPVFSIQSAEKTFATFLLTTSNPGGHSSAPRPDNAIFDAAEAIQAVRTLRFPAAFNEITRPMVESLAARSPGAFGTALKALLANPQDTAARGIAERNPESALMWTTCVPTMLKAGNAPNALPQTAEITVNCRILPGTSIESVQASLQDAVQKTGARVTLDNAGTASPVSPVNPPLFAAIRRAVHANYPGAPVEPSMSSGGTDGREFRSQGIPTYGAGSLAMVRVLDARAHGANERLLLKSFDKELVFWDTLLRDLGK